MKIKMEIDSLTMLKGRFSDTLSSLNGYIMESQNDDGDYSTEAVESRLKEIKENFMRELQALSSSIVLTRPKQ